MNKRTRILFSACLPWLIACSEGVESRIPNRWDAFNSVLHRITEVFDPTGGLALHPFLGLISREPGGRSVRLGEFDLVDTLVIKTFVESSEGGYHICSLTPQKSCDRSVDKVHVILSRLEDLGGRRFGLVALVFDDRSPPGVWAHYTSEFRPRRGGWQIVSFRKTN